MSDSERVIIDKIDEDVRTDEKAYFRIDRVWVKQRTDPGKKWSKSKDWEVLERDNSAAVIIYNYESEKIVLTRQFRAPLVNRVDPNNVDPDAFLLEAVAGVIKKTKEEKVDGVTVEIKGETAKQTIIRETMEEVGYVLTEDELEEIGWFYPSPGGSSEQIYLFLAPVCDAQRFGPGGGKVADGEFIERVEMPVEEFFDMVEKKEIHDSKIMFALDALKEHIAGNKYQIARSGISYGFRAASLQTDTRIRLRTGELKNIHNVSIWVNSENTLMEMNQFVGESISSTIRSLGALKGKNNSLEVDLIGNALRKEYYKAEEVVIGTVLTTTSGQLNWFPRHVEKIYHVASVHGQVGQKVTTSQKNIKLSVERVLEKAHRDCASRWNTMQARKIDSILIPTMGTGNGKLAFEDAFTEIIKAVIEFVEANPKTKIKDINLHVYNADDFVRAREIIAGRVRKDTGIPVLKIIPRAKAGD